MNEYKITISSNINTNVSRIFLVKTELTKGLLMDIIIPLTRYKVNVEEHKSTLMLSFESFLIELIQLKLTTKVAKNVTNFKIQKLAEFTTLPNIMLELQYKDEQIVTYINLPSVIFEHIFPQLKVKFDKTVGKIYIDGELHFDNPKDNCYILYHHTVEETVVYETIILQE